MAVVRTFRFAASALLCLALAGADAPSTLTLKVMALGEKGPVGDIAAQDWKIKVAGQDAQVLAQRPPAETEKEGQKWAFVLLPIRDPEFRETALYTLATFMSSLPPSDSVLVALRTAKGLECLTPGFTVRPSLWAKALDQARNDLGARLPGNSDAMLNFVAGTGKEPGEDSVQPVTEFLARLAAKRLDRRTDDITNLHRSITEVYSTDDLAGYTIATAKTLKSVEALGEAISREPGEKHLIIISRNEIDDLANPAWGKMNAKRALASAAEGADDEAAAKSALKAETMVRDMTLAFDAFKSAVVRLGLEVHCVGATGAGFSGAFSEAAAATGGNAYPFNRELGKRLPPLLSLWAARYELKVAVPEGLARPAAIVVKSPRKGVQVFSSSSR